MSEKKVWLLLRGLVREQRHWGNFPDILQTYFPDDKIVLYDAPGNGQRYNEKSRTRIVDMVEDVRAFLKNQSIEQPVYIIALSLGGIVAVEWMNKNPDECAGTILISTSLRGLNPFYQRLLPANYPVIFKSLLSPGSIRKHESSNLKLVSNIIANDIIKRDSIINHWVDYAKQCPVSAINGIRQLLAAISFHLPEHQPDVPILVLRSLADHLVDPRCSLSLARHWTLPIETHKTAGHDIPLDDSRWVCEKINLWLQNNIKSDGEC